MPGEMNRPKKDLQGKMNLEPGSVNPQMSIEKCAESPRENEPGETV